MKNELKDIRLIDSYLLGHLNEAEQIELENRLKVDHAFIELFEVQQLILKGVSSLALKESIHSAAKSYQNKFVLKRLFWGLTIISSIGVAAYLINQEQNVEAIVEPVIKSELTVDTLNASDISRVFIENDATVKVNSINSELARKQDTSISSNNNPTISPYTFELKESQLFRINSTRDTTLFGQEGTVITIKANSFGKVESNTIELRLKEYYKMSDIAFSNLSTETTGGKILETGGMIHLIAEDINGSELMLEKDVELKFPKKEHIEGMKLFDGIEEEEIKWEVNKDFKKVDETPIKQQKEVGEMQEVFTLVQNMPLFPGTRNSKKSEQKIKEFLNLNLVYPKIAIQNEIEGKVYVSFSIDESGLVSNPKVIRSLTPLLDLEAIRCVKKLPRFKPGTQRGKPVRVQYSFPIVFNLGNNESSSYKEMNAFEELTSGMVDSIMKSTDKSESDLLMPEIEKSDLAEYYIFSTSNFGWINCDRFTSSKYNKINFRLSNTEANVPVKIIFHRIKSQMINYPAGKKSIFKNIPLKEKVTVFSIKMQNDKPLVAFQETTISNELFQLDYKEVSFEEIKLLRNKIDDLN